MKETVLITGASGFLGFHLIEAALQQNLDVHVAIRKSSSVEHLEGLPVSFAYLDYSDIDSLKKEIDNKKYSYIIHAAGLTKARNQQEYNQVNADFTYNLAKAASLAQNKLKKFVFISSLAAIGPLNVVNGMIDELTPPRPVTAYGKSKLMAEQRLQELSIPLIILRPTAVYGPREKDIFIVFKMIKQGLEPYLGRIEQRLSFIYAKDLAVLTVSSLCSNYTGIYNITDGNSYSRYALGDYVKKFLQKKTFKFHLPFAVVKIIAATSEATHKIINKTPALNKEKLNELAAVNWICNIDKAKKELGFNPMYNLEAGVKESLLWYKKSEWL